MKSIFPYDQKIITHYNPLSNSEIEHQLTKCNAAYLHWKDTTVAQRITCFKNLIQEMDRQKTALATLISKEMGKPVRESVSEIEKCISLIQYFIKNVNDFLSPSEKKYDDLIHIINHEPTGIVLGIMPWNFPFWQVFRYIIPNIIAGNTCILKHAPNVLGCGNAIEKLFITSGFPKQVFSHFIIHIKDVEILIANPKTQGVCVTGSTKAGSAVASLAGKHLKKSVLELGGNDAFVILEDADLKKALQNAFAARMRNAGQICIAPKRIFIPQHLLEESIAILKPLFNKIIQGDPLHKNTTQGPISKPEFLNILQQQVDNSIKHGATLILGGQTKAPFFEPTLLIFNTDNPILQEEIFGPVVSLVTYTNEENLLQIINQSPYGLAASIWTKDMVEAQLLARKIEVGYVTINDIVKSDPKIPFGGIKNSGYGKELGLEGFRTFLNQKSIVLANV